MKVVAFTPIKLHSERLQRKNTELLGGRPLLNYLIGKMDQVRAIDENYVFCSDHSILQSLDSYHVKFLERPAELDRNETLGYEIYRVFVELVDADVYVLYHVTSPLLRLAYIQEGLDAVLRRGYDSALSVWSIQTFAWCKGKPVNYDPKHVVRTQDLSSVEVETSGFYMFHRHVFVEMQRRVGENPYFVKVDFESSIDIDDEKDFELCEMLLEGNSSD